MRKIKLILFSSALHDGASVMSSREPLFNALRSFAELEIIYPSMLCTGNANGPYDGSTDNKTLETGKDERTICFIATGGTEELFRQFMDFVPKPVTLLSDGFHNSLAASFEISTYLEQNGIEFTLLNAPLDYNPNYFKTLEQKIFGELPPIQSDDLSSRNQHPLYEKSDRKALAGKKLGLIGGSSSWLISSNVDTAYVEAEYGVKFISIPLSEVEELYKAVSEEDSAVKKICNRMVGLITDDRQPKDLADAARMYVALKQISLKYQLDALTLKCFGLLDSCKTTACLALSLLNDEGVVSGCEGDVPSLWTMLYAKEVLGKTTFMCNPSSSNRAELTLDLAHCTIPLSMVHGYRLPSHFESSIGIGVAGSMPSGRYRIIKFSGSKLDRFYSVEGNLIMNTNVAQRCRTQIRFKFDNEADFNGFFTTTKSNHVMMVAL